MAVRHITLFRLNDDVTVSNEEVLSRLRSLSASAGMLSWEVAVSSDVRRGRVIVVNGLFASHEALVEFVPSPAHVAVAQFMRDIATWLVADYEVLTDC